MPMFRIQLEQRPKRIVRGTIPMRGESPAGERWSVNNYFFEKDGRPFFAVAGEMHYARCHPRRWEDGLLKMKAGGINLVSTYVFWNHHEEVEGRFDWSGRRDLRRFIELCGKTGLQAIVRIGPFCHGEVRNGGVPDWAYGRPFPLRSNDPAYLALVRRLYGQIAWQLEGLCLKDGGPVLAIQVENEYQHSAAPWELAAATSREWLPGGSDGESHLRLLKGIAREAGIEVPFWTATAWGGAAVPLPDTLPLWGGYAYQPWLFYGGIKAHPVTPEYLFRDHHNDKIKRTYNFEPRYSPEDYPYSCCEMGGGMQVWYPYRFQVDPRSVEAMAVVKLAGGCNFLGYYMYHGGTNPRGAVNPFLNEHSCPRLSYDFQAPLGEFGQAREHYHRLRLIHRLAKSWEDWLTPLPTVLPPGASELDPLDDRAVRWSLRTDGHSGLLCLTNYQDHHERPDLAELAWEIGTEGGRLRIPAEGSVGLAAGESCLLPFNLPIGGARIISASAQPLGPVSDGSRRLWLFVAPEGMEPVFQVEDSGGVRIIRPTLGQAFALRPAAGPEEHVLVLAKASALMTQFIDAAGSGGATRTYAIQTKALAYPGQGGELFRLESEGDVAVEFSVFPDLPAGCAAGSARIEKTGGDSWFSHYRAWPAPRPLAGQEARVDMLNSRQARLQFAPGAMEGLVELLVRVAYEGDIGNAYIDGSLVADNFSNGAPWEIGLSCIEPELRDKGLLLDIIPVKKGCAVTSDTTMAGRLESSEEQLGAIKSVHVVPVRRICLYAGLVRD